MKIVCKITILLTVGILQGIDSEERRNIYHWTLDPPYPPIRYSPPNPFTPLPFTEGPDQFGCSQYRPCPREKECITPYPGLPGYDLQPFSYIQISFYTLSF